MILSRSYHNLNFDIAISNTTGASRVCALPYAAEPVPSDVSVFPQTQPKALTQPVEGNWKVCYVLLPEGVMLDVLKWAEKAADENSCDLVLISGMDWNADMSPWLANGVMKKEKLFTGGAATFLKELIRDSIPAVEQWLGLKAPTRYLIGVSLSGLFAIWSLVETDVFKGVASVSGSLWFDGFVDWLAKHPLAGCPAPRLYLSLGRKEKNVADKRMATVEDCTVAVVESLREKGADVTFELLPGTHFSPIVPRLEAAFSVILASADPV